MVVFSTLRRQLQNSMNVLRRSRTPMCKCVVIKRYMGGHGHGHFKIQPSSFNFYKAADLIHFYTCIAFLIYAPIILYCNIFIGDAVISEIPDGYVPKYYEYFAHPITRTIAWLQGDPQKEYELFLHFLYFEDWNMKQRKMDKMVKQVMKRNKDYKAYYYRPIDAGDLREQHEFAKVMIENEAPDPIIRTGFPLDFKDDGDMPSLEE